MKWPPTLQRPHKSPILSRNVSYTGTMHKYKKQLLVLVGVIAAVSIGVGIFLATKNNDEQKVEYFDKSIIDAYKQKMEANNTLGPRPTYYESFISSGTSVYWVDDTVVDGMFTCTIFDTETYQIYGKLSRLPGYVAPNSTDPAPIYYKNSKHSKETIFALLEKSCTTEKR